MYKRYYFLSRFSGNICLDSLPFYRLNIRRKCRLKEAKNHN